MYHFLGEIRLIAYDDIPVGWMNARASPWR